LASGSSCGVKCDEGFFVKAPGTTSCQLGQVSLAECAATPSMCDASAAPAHGFVGNCTASLASGSICQPVCGEGYIVSGPTTCSIIGRLTVAVCVPQGGCAILQLPANSKGPGNCPNVLGSGESCQPECNEGYEPSTFYCSQGALQMADCSPQESQTTAYAVGAGAAIALFLLGLMAMCSCCWLSRRKSSAALYLDNSPFSSPVKPLVFTEVSPQLKEVAVVPVGDFGLMSLTERAEELSRRSRELEQRSDALELERQQLTNERTNVRETLLVVPRNESTVESVRVSPRLGSRELVEVDRIRPRLGSREVVEVDRRRELVEVERQPLTTVQTLVERRPETLVERQPLTTVQTFSERRHPTADRYMLSERVIHRDIRDNMAEESPRLSPRFMRTAHHHSPRPHHLGGGHEDEDPDLQLDDIHIAIPSPRREKASMRLGPSAQILGASELKPPLQMDSDTPPPSPR